MFSKTVIVTANNKASHEDLLEDLARLRHRIFVQQLGWTLPLATNEREQDQFDDERAIYVVIVGMSGTIRAAVRLHDTVGPTLLNTVYPHLVEGLVPRSPAVWEGTRMLVHPDLSPAQGTTAFLELLAACVSFGMSCGIECWVSVSDPVLERALRRAGAATKRLGPIVEVEPGVSALALRMECDCETLRRIELGLARLKHSSREPVRFAA